MIALRPSSAILPLLPFLRKLQQQLIHYTTNTSMERLVCDGFSTQLHLKRSHSLSYSLTHILTSIYLMTRAEVLPCLLLLLLFPFLFLEKLHYVATRTRSSTKYQSAIIPMRSNKSHTTPKKTKRTRIFT